MRFRLYPEAKPWWSFNDYAVVLSVMLRLSARSVLEFGPGSSTLALIEGGAGQIDCCEDEDQWFDVYRSRLQDCPPGEGIVTMHRYTWGPVVRIDGVDDRRYDLALIDGPRDQVRRASVLAYALDRCTYVLVALESAVGSQVMRDAVAEVSALCARPVEWMEDTGPLAGSFALIGPAC